MVHKELSRLSFYCRIPAVILAFCWIVGLVCGALYSLATECFVSVLMRMLPFSHASIVSLVVNLFLLLIIYFASSRFVPIGFIYLIVLLKAFLFGFCMVSIYMYYGTAGWMVHLLASFSEAFTVVPFLWFSIRSICGYKKTMMRDAAICLFIYIAVSVIDQYCVSPYFAYVMSFCKEGFTYSCWI